MRIVFVSLSKIPSDTANSIQVMKVCQSFAQLGHDVRLFVPGPKPDDLTLTLLQSHYGLQTLFSIEWLPIRSRRMFPFTASARARHLRPDLIYAWPMQSAVLGLLAGSPTIVELHDYPKGNLGPMWFKLFLAIPGQKRLLPISEALRHALNLPVNKTMVVPDGVDLERYMSLPSAAAARIKLDLPAALTVLCTGHLYSGRGADLFLTLAGKFPAVNFVWVGGRAEDVEYWRQRAASLENVIFTGFIVNERIPLYQSSADILLMPYDRVISTSSGGNTANICSPMKMFEYMAAGRVILASDLTVFHEVLDDDTAVFCPPEDAGKWEEALGGLLVNENQRMLLGQNARNAVKRYSWLERARRSLDGF